LSTTASKRTQCGFGLLRQNTKIDIAAKGHAEWLLINNYSGHGQAENTPGFTGVALWNRMANAGYGTIYTFNAGEVVSSLFNATKINFGQDGVRGLLNAPYHALGLMSGNRDIGIGVSDKYDVGITPNNRTAIVIDMGRLLTDNEQLALSGSVRTYPCEGTVGVDTKLLNESPNPIANRDLHNNPIGSSVVVVIDKNHILAITSATMINSTNSSSVKMLTPVTGSNDVNKNMTVNEGFVSPDVPLVANTKYQVTLNGTDNGAVFSRTFNFTTGNGN
jgi:hypothetical protein